MAAISLPLLQEHLDRALGPDLLAPAYRSKWSEANPSAGLCSVACEAAWFLLGGSGSDWVPHVARDGQEGTHWWLQNAQTGERFDPTQAQYRSVGEVPPYERGLEGRGGGFMGIRKDSGSEWGFDRKPSIRAKRLLDRMLANASAVSIQDLVEQLQYLGPQVTIQVGRRLRV